MTVALKDVILLTQILSPFLQAPSSSMMEVSDPSSRLPQTISVDWDELREALREWHWSRKAFSTTINILSVALYDLFGANGIAVSHIDGPYSQLNDVAQFLLQTLTWIFFATAALPISSEVAIVSLAQYPCSLG